MIKTSFVILLAACLIGCVDDPQDHDKPEAPSAEEEAPWGHGIVSDDPPGAGDWEEGPGDTDVDEEADPDEEEEVPGSITSYENCSNVMPMSPWDTPETLSHPCNFRLTDQNGNDVELYDFEGSVILLDFSTMWCGVCKTVASHVQSLHDQHNPFVAITVLTETTSGDPPVASDLNAWAAEYGITTAPVLGGNSDVIGTGDEEWWVQAWPTFYLIDKDFMVRKFHPGWNESMVIGYIEDLLQE